MKGVGASVDRSEPSADLRQFGFSEKMLLHRAVSDLALWTSLGLLSPQPGTGIGRGSVRTPVKMHACEDFSLYSLSDKSRTRKLKKSSPEEKATHLNKCRQSMRQRLCRPAQLRAFLAIFHPIEASGSAFAPTSAASAALAWPAWARLQTPCRIAAILKKLKAR